jgi:tetratricopeptide (TPR) repeat protein
MTFVGTRRSVFGLTARVALVALGACGHASPEAEEPPPADPVSEVEAEELFHQGVELARGGDLVRAEQYIGASMTRGFPEERAMPILLKVCIAASRMRVAIGYAEPYLERHPNDWPLRLLVASLYLGLEETAKARHELEYVLETEPDQPEPHYLMALLLRDEVGDPDSAETHLRRYLELAPEGEHAAEATHALRTIRMPVRGEASSASESSEASVSRDAVGEVRSGEAPPEESEESGTHTRPVRVRSER